MNIGFDQPLYLLPFDHRESFETKLFGWEGALSAEHTAEIAAAKRVIYDGFQAAILAVRRRTALPFWWTSSLAQPFCGTPPNRDI